MWEGFMALPSFHTKWLRAILNNKIINLNKEKLK
jgi:hypothetical protein